jgi:hypothetical protein
MLRRPCVIIALFVLVGAGCASRYRLPLYLDFDENRRTVKVDQTQYLLNARLGDPYQEQKIIAGSGKCLVLLTSTSGEKIDMPSKGLLSFDEFLRIRLFVELPEHPAPVTIELTGHSFVQLLGRYALQPEEKIFLPSSGTMVIDSIAKSHLYATVKGQFANTKGWPLNLDGQFRAKIKK